MAQSVLLLSLALLLVHGVVAYDPTILTDFGLTGATSGDNFTSSAFTSANLPPNPAAGGLVLVPQFAAQFPGLTGLGISSLFFKLGTGGVVPPHIHTRATEIFIVLSGSFEVGFVDSTNTLFSASLSAGEQFVFPVGLVHYQKAGSSSATGIAVFNSESPGVTLLPSNIFASNPAIPADVLSASFKISADTVADIRDALTM